MIKILMVFVFVFMFVFVRIIFYWVNRFLYMYYKDVKIMSHNVCNMQTRFSLNTVKNGHILNRLTDISEAVAALLFII